MAAYEFLFQEDLYQVTNPVLVLLDKPWDEVRDEDKVLLTKILSSIKLSIDQVQIMHANETSVAALSTYQASKIISFGVPLLDSNERYKKHQIGTSSLILSDSLQQLDDVSKKSLWAALKQL